MSVSRETKPCALGRAERLGKAADPRYDLLLQALAEEPDPHTTVSRPERAREIHVADSLSGLEVDEIARARRIADLGAGAGFPGLPLAIALPGAKVDLIESAGRKTAVIDRLIQAAKVDNARSVTARAEEWGAVAPALGGGREAYDAVTARAVAALPVLVEYAAPLLRPAGVLVAWKGTVAADELQQGKGAAEELGMALEEVRRVEPFEGARERHLVVFRKVARTPGGYPRRPGMAAKRPLGRHPQAGQRRSGANQSGTAARPYSDRPEP